MSNADRIRAMSDKELTVGMKVMRSPEIGLDDNGRKQTRPMRGTVCFVHPQGRYHTVEFETPGGIVRECFPGVEI